MSSRYIVDTESINPDEVDDGFTPFTLGEKDRIEQVSTDSNQKPFFSHEGESDFFWKHIKTELVKMIAPLRTSSGGLKFIIFAILNTVFSLLFFFLKWVVEPFLRGWRLQIVQNVALGKKTTVPGVNLDLLFKYFVKGMVLIVMRIIYFLPLFIVVMLSGAKMLNLAKEVLFFIWGKIVGGDTFSWSSFLAQKIPEAGIEIVIQLVVLGFYAAFVWPIYRIIMIQYALKLTSFTGFLDPKVIRKSIGIFRKHTATVYGIYGFVVAIDVLVVWLARIINIFSLGLLFWLMPTFHLGMRHWVKGYSYGQLGKKLIEEGALQPKREDKLGNNIDNKSYV